MVFLNEAIAIGGMILTDTAVLVILAVIVGARNGGLTTAFWIQLIASLTVFTLIMFFVIPPYCQMLFYQAEK